MIHCTKNFALVIRDNSSELLVLDLKSLNNQENKTENWKPKSVIIPLKSQSAIINAVYISEPEMLAYMDNSMEIFLVSFPLETISLLIDDSSKIDAKTLLQKEIFSIGKASKVYSYCT